MTNVALYYAELKKSSCFLCSDLVSSRRQVVTHKGNPDSSVLIIGQNPGASEDFNGIPFSGKSGKLLDQAIHNAGFDPNRDFFFTNSVLCKTEQNAKPSIEHIRNCSSHLLKSVSVFDTILCLGQVAFSSLVNLFDPFRARHIASDSITKYLTRGVPISIASKSVFVAYHPAFIVRMTNPTETKEFQSLVFEIQATKRKSLMEINAQSRSDNTIPINSISIF